MGEPVTRGTCQQDRGSAVERIKGRLALGGTYVWLNRTDVEAMLSPRVSGEGVWAIGSWLSAALDDPSVCAEMKRDINEWFDNGGHLRANLPTAPSHEGTKP